MKSVEGLEALETSQEGKDLIAKFNEAAAKGKEANNRAIETGMSGTLQEGIEKYGDVTKAARDYARAADAIVQYNDTGTRMRADEAMKTAFVARITFVLLGALTLVAGTLLSLGITRSITIPISRSSSHIDLMAKGDFSIKVSEHATKRRDEMGIFARSMDAMNSGLRLVLSEMISSAGRFLPRACN